MRLHTFAGKSMRRPMAVIQIPTNLETSKTRMKTPMKHCYSKSYSPESSLDYEWQVNYATALLCCCLCMTVWLREEFGSRIFFPESSGQGQFGIPDEFVLQPLSDA